MADFPPQNMANLLGAFPKLGCTPPAAFWDKALPAVQRALPNLKPQVRCDAERTSMEWRGMEWALLFACLLAWCACLPCFCLSIYLSVSLSIRPNRTERPPPTTIHPPSLLHHQEISTITNALAKLEVDPGPIFVAALGQQAAARMGEFSPQDLSVSLVSLARLGHDPTPAFLTAAAAAAHHLLPRCNAQVGLVWFVVRLALGRLTDQIKSFMRWDSGRHSRKQM